MDYDLTVLLYSKKRLEAVAMVARAVRAIAEPRRTFLVVNGSELDSAAVRRAFGNHEKVEVLQHDNTGVELGGYQAAIDRMQGNLPARLVVMNDTLGSHDLPSRAYLRAFMRTMSMEEKGAVVGTVELTERAMSLCGLHSSRWIRSHFFGLDLDALNATECRLYHPEIDLLITASPDPDVFFGQAVEGTLRQHLSRWLFSSSGHRWYAAEPLTLQNCDRMAAKARAILQEKYLSMIWNAGGIAFRPPYLDRAARLSHRAEKSLGLLRRHLRLQ